MRKYRRQKLSYVEKALRQRRLAEMTWFRHISMIMLAGWLGLMPSWSYAGPQGEQVVAGDVSFERNGNLTEITASHNSIINYDSFNIGSDETVRFIQPTESSRVLNRIQGDDPTTIAGRLLANGQVYIVNPAGIYFTNGSLVDVGELYAAAGSITDSEFIAGNDHFSQVSGEIVNDGRIMAQTVALVGQYVANNGEIISQDGLITLAVGDDVYITRQGSHIMVQVGSLSQTGESQQARVDNTGVINAGKGEVSLVSGDMYSLAMGVSNSGSISGSTVKLESGEKGMTVVCGTIDVASKGENNTGGKVEILGERVGLLGADLDATGTNGGGEVLVGGDYQGKGQVQNSVRTVVDEDATINADALDNGDGGKVIIWADDYTHYEGDISARGGSQSGDGGLVEVSGKKNLNFDGWVDTTATNGQTGELLLDPEYVGISGGGGANDGRLDIDYIITENESPGSIWTISQAKLESITSENNITISANSGIGIYNLVGNLLDLQATAGTTVSFLVDGNNNAASDFFDTDFSGSYGIVSTGPGNIQTAGGNIVISSEIVDVDSIVTNGGSITISALDIDITNQLNAGTGNVHIYPKTASIMDIGFFDGGLDVSNAELNRIFTSGILTLGDSVYTTSMELEDVSDIAGVTGTVRFMSNGFIRSTNTYSNTITTPKVEILADDDVTLNSFLAVGKDLVINADYDDDGTGTLTLDAADDTISSTNGNISITASDLVFNNTDATKISTANGNITITASDSRSMAITNAVYDFRITDAELDRIVATGTVTLDTASDFRFNAATSYTGNLAVVSGGSVSQASAVTVTGNISVTADVSGGGIVLDSTSNNVSGTVSLATLGTGTATWYENGNVDLGTVNVGDDLTIRSSTGTIVQTGVITAGGDASFTTSANDKVITLNTQSNAVGGTVAFTTNNTAGHVSWKEAAAVSLAASTVDGNLTVVSDTGGISNAGTLTVSGTGTFTASTNNQTIDLNNSLNNITGAVAFTTGGTTGNVYFDNGSNAIDLATSNIGGLFDLDTGGHLTVTGDVVTARAMTINADDITLNGSLNSGAYNITILPDDNGTIGLGSAVGGMTLTDVELDKITSSGTVRFDTNSAITADTITPANISGTVWLDSAAGVTFSGGGSSFVNNLTISGNDLAISQAVSATGDVLISAVGVPVYLGTAGGNMSIDGAELELITAANLEINAGTNQHIYVNNVTAANSANISGTVTLDSSQKVIFQTNDSTFRTLVVEADDGIEINNGITLTTTVGGMSLDGNTAAPDTAITTSGNVTLTSADLVTLNETTLGGNLAINAADLEIDATLNYGANSVTVTGSGSIDVGDDNGGTMVVSQDDLLALSGTGPLSFVTAAGDIVVDNVSAASSDNIDGLLTLSATGDTYKVVFNGANSTFNTLTVNATDGIDIDNVMLATDVGALTLNPNTDGGLELITFTGVNAGMATATDFSLGSISVTGALTLRANGNITFTASQSAPGGFNIYADNDGNGSGVFTLNNGLSMSTTDSDINITGMNLILEDDATLNAGTGDISFGTQSATTLYVGGGLSIFGISDDELDRMSATEVIFGGVSSAQYSSIIVDGNLSAGTKILTFETDGTFTVNDGATLSTTDKAITISADDLDMSATGVINAGTGLLSLNTMAAGTDLCLGDSSQEFNVSDSELSRITAGGLTATVLADDDIYVSGISDADGANVGAITLIATGADSRVIIDTGAVQVDSLSASASDGITIDQNITTDVGDLVLEGDSNNADDGNSHDDLVIANGLTFTSADSITLSATTGGIDAAGALTLNAVNGVTLSDAYAASGAGALTVDADTDDDGTGTFTTGSTVSTVDSLITITAGDVELGGELTAGTGGISILPSETGGQTVVLGGVGGDMTLSVAEVGYLNTSGILTVGNANTTSLTIGADPTDVTGNMVLISTGTAGNVVINSAITSDGTLNITARDGLTVNDDITTVGAITIDSDSDDNGGLLTVGAGAIIDSTDTVIAITAGDIDINATGGLDSGSTSMSITQSQAAGTIGLGATGGTMTLADSELDRITATGLTIYAPSNVTVNGVTAGGGNVSGTFLVDAAGKVTLATGHSDFNTLEIQADDGVEINGVVVTTTVGSILIDGNVDNSADTTDTIAFIGTAGLDANTTLTLTATNDGITSAGDTGLEANGAVSISDKFVAASDLTVISNNSTVTFSSDLTGGGATDISADDGITFNGNVSLGGATVIDADVDAGDNNGTFTLLAGKAITTNGNTLTIIGDNLNLAGSIAGGAGLLTFEVSDGGSVGLADGAGNYQLDSAELTRITGQTGGLTIQGTAAQVTVDGMTTDSNLAGISGLVTIDASNNGGKVAFSGSASKFTALTVSADRGISSSVDLTTTNGNMSLDGDWDNTNDIGSDGIVLTGGRTLTSVNGSITLAATTDGISDSGALTVYADDGISIEDDLTVSGQITLDSDRDNDTVGGTLTVTGLVDSNDNLIEIVADDMAISGGGGFDSGTANIRITPSTAISMGLGIGAGAFSLTDAELDTIVCQDLYLGMGVVTDLGVSGVSSSTINGDIFIDIDGTISIAGAGWTATADNNDFDIIADDIALTGALNSGSGAIRLRTADGGGFGLGTADAGMDISSAELALITSSGGLTIETVADEDITVSGILTGSTNNITGDLILDADSDNSQVNFTVSDSIFANNVTVNADDGVSMAVNLTVQSGDLVIDGDTDGAGEGNSRDYIYIADGVTLAVSSGDMTLSAVSGKLLADGALTLRAAGNIALEDSLTTNYGVSTNKALLIEAGDLDINGTALDTDAGNITIRPYANSNMGLGGTASGALDITDAEFDKLYSSGTVTFGGSTAENITVNGLTATANISGPVEIISGRNIRSITFSGSASSFQSDLTIQALDGITLNESVTAGGVITVNADSDANDNLGTLTVASGKTLVSSDNDIFITANDMVLAGGTTLPARNINAGAGDITITDSDNSGIGLGGTAVANGLNLTDAEFGQLKAANIEFVTNGTIRVDGISAANSDYISGRVTLDTGGNIEFITTESTFHELVSEADGIISLNADVTTDDGLLNFYADTNANGGGADTITVGAGVEITSADTILLQASAAVADGEINAVGAFTVTALSGINIDNSLTAGGDLVLDADSNTDGTGDLTIKALASVNADGHDVDITANSVTFGAGVLTNVEDLALRATVSGDLTVNGDFGNSGSIELQSVNGTVTVNSAISSDKSITLTAKSGITVNNNIEADADTDNPLGESVVINADSNGDGTGSLTVTGAGKSIVTNDNDLTITAADLVMQNDYALDAGTGKLTITESHNDGMGLGDTAMAGGLNISKDELSRMTAAHTELITGGAVDVDNIANADSAGIVLLTIDSTGLVSFVNNASVFNSLTVESDYGIDIEQNITTDTGSLVLEGDADNANDGYDKIAYSAGVVLDSAADITIDATTGTSTGAGALTITADDHISINDSISVSGDMVITADNEGDNTGTLTFAVAGKSIDTNDNDLTLTAADLVMQNDYALDAGTGKLTITESHNDGMGLGDTAMAGGLNISKDELSRMTAAHAELITGGAVDVDNIANADSAGIVLLTTDSTGLVSFVNNASVFNSLTVESDYGIDIEQNITTDTGSLVLEGDADNANDGYDKIAYSAGVVLDSAADITIDATTGTSTGAGALTITADDHISINDSISVSGDMVITADNEGDNTGTLTFAVAGKSIDTNDNDLTLTAADLVMQNDYALDAGTGKLTITESHNDGIGLGDTAMAGGLNISKDELSRMTAAHTELITGGAVDVDNIANADSAGIVLLTIDSTGLVSFVNNASVFNSLTVESDYGIDIEQNITTDTGSLVLEGDADNANDGYDKIAYSAGVVLDSAADITIDATTGTSTGAGALTITADDHISINDSISVSGDMVITADNEGDNTGTLTFAVAGKSIDTNDNDLTLTAADLVMQNDYALDAGTGKLTITESHNDGIGLGDTAMAGGLNISKDELSRMTAAHTELITGGAVDVDNIANADSAGIVLLTIDSTGLVSFVNNASVFNSLTVESDYGIDIDQNITTDTGSLVLEGDADNANDGYDKIAYSAGVVLDSAADITIDATTGTSTGAGALTITADDHISINDSISVSGDMVITADNEGDNTGTLTFAVAGKSIDTNDNDLTLTAADLVMQNDYALDAGTGKLTIAESHNDGIGLGDTAMAGGLNISNDELSRMTTAHAELITGGNVYVDNISEPFSNNIVLLTIDNAGQSQFINSDSVFNSLTVESDNGIDINVNIICGDGGSMSLDGDADIAFDGNDDIDIAAGLTLSADNTITLSAQTGKITAAGTLDLLSEGDITINDNLTAADVITINTDGIIANNDGTGDLIIAADATVSTQAVNEEIYITANDLFLNGYIRTGTSVLDITVSDNQNYYLGSNAVENGSNNGFNISATELSHIYTGDLIMRTAGDVNISDILAGAADNVTYMVTFIIDGHATLDNNCIFNAITIYASDGIDMGGDLATQTGDVILDGDYNDIDDGNGLDSIVFAAGSTINSADVLRLDATNGTLIGLGSLMLEAKEGIVINDDLSTNGDLTLNADSDLDGTGDLTSAPGKSYSCNNNDLNLTAANVQFDSGITNVDGLYLTATTGDMMIVGAISFNNDGDLGLTVTNGTCLIDKVLNTQGAIIISASDGVTISKNVTSQGDMTINADNDAVGSGDLTVTDGVAIVSNGGMIEITARDVNELDGTINSGMNITKIDSTGSGISLGSSTGTGMRLSNAELDNITASTLELVTSGDIRVGAVSGASNETIDTVVLDAEGRIVFENGESVFNILDVQAESGIQINANLRTDTGELFFNNDSICLSGGSQGISFADGVVVSSALGMTLGGSGNLTANGAVTLLAGGDLNILSDFNINSELNIDIDGYDLYITNSNVDISNGPAEIYAGDLILTGSLSSEFDTITLIPYGYTLGLGSGLGSMQVDNQELASITADRLVFDTAGEIKAVNVVSGTTDSITVMQLDSESAVIFDNAELDSSLEVYSGGGISQLGYLKVSGYSCLVTNQNDKTIIMANSDNSLVGDISIRTQGDSGISDVILNNGITAIALADYAVVAGDLTLETVSDIGQTTAIEVAGDLYAQATGPGNHIVMGHDDNRVAGTVALYTAQAGNIEFDNGNADIDIAEIDCGGSLDMLTAGDIRAWGSVVVQSAARFVTYSDSGSDIILEYAGSSYGNVTALSRNSAGTGYSSGNISLIEAGSTEIADIGTLGDLDLISYGDISESGTMTIAGITTIKTLNDNGGAVLLTGTNSFGLLDISVKDQEGVDYSAGQVTINEIGTMELVSIATAGGIELSCDDLDLTGQLRGSNLLLYPRQDSTGITIGDGIANGMQLDNTEIGKIVDGFNLITIGRADLAGEVNITETGFTDPVRVVTGVDITINGAVTGSGNSSVALVSGSDVFVNDNISTQGCDIVISGTNIGFSGNNSVTTGGVSGYVTMAGSIATNNGLSVVSGDGISLNNDLTNTGGGEVYLGGDLLLAGDVAIDAGTASFEIDGKTDGLYDLVVNSSGGNVVFGSDIGLSQEIANLRVVTSGEGTIEFNSEINVNGDIYLSSDQELGIVPASATIFKRSQGDLIFNVGGSFEVGLNNRMTVAGGSLIITSGSGSVTLADTTVKENIVVDAANSAGDIVLLVRDKAFSYTMNKNGTIKLMKDKGVSVAAEGYIKFNGEIVPDGLGNKPYFVTGNKAECDGLTGYKVYTIKEFQELQGQDDTGNDIVIVYIPVNDNQQVTVDAIAAAGLRDRNNIYYDRQIGEKIRQLALGYFVLPEDFDNKDIEKAVASLIDG